MENESLEVKKAETKDVKQKLIPVFSLLKSSISIWWKNFRKFILIYLMALLYLVIPFIIIIAVSGLAASSLLFFDIVLLILPAVSFLLGIYYYIIVYSAFFILVKNNYQINIKTIFKEVKPLSISYIPLCILTGILFFLWTSNLIIPSIIYSIFYVFALCVYFFEDKAGLAAIRRIRELVKGYEWAVASRFCFIALIIWLFSEIISFSGIWSILIQIINILIAPIALLFIYQIYKDLVNIKK